jgi:hypothetical protein
MRSAPAIIILCNLLDAADAPVAYILFFNILYNVFVIVQRFTFWFWHKLTLSQTTKGLKKLYIANCAIFTLCACAGKIAPYFNQIDDLTNGRRNFSSIWPEYDDTNNAKKAQSAAIDKRDLLVIYCWALEKSAVKF